MSEEKVCCLIEVWTTLFFLSHTRSHTLSAVLFTDPLQVVDLATQLARLRDKSVLRGVFQYSSFNIAQIRPDLELASQVKTPSLLKHLVRGSE